MTAGGSSASGVALGLFLFILLSVLVALAVWGVYAYRNPTSPSGLFLIKVRKRSSLPARCRVSGFGSP